MLSNYVYSKIEKVNKPAHSHKYMLWFEKIKNAFKSEEKPAEVKIETLSLDQLKIRIETKIKENDEKDSVLKKEIFHRISEFDRALASSIDNLSNINLKERKEHERIKSIVLENLHLYISQLKRLLNKLNALENYLSKELLEKVYLLMNEFSSLSHIPFEKATILIGKDLEVNKNILIGFIKDLNKIKADNETYFRHSEQALKLNHSLNELNTSLSHINNLSQTISSLNDKSKDKKEETKKISEKIERIKNSEEFKKDLEKKEIHKNSLSNLDTKIRIIKQKINFKSLAKTYYQNPEASRLIERYSNNFKSALENDENMVFFDLIKEDSGTSHEDLTTLKNKIIELNSFPATKTEKEMSELQSHLTKTSNDISNIEEDMATEQKKMNKFEQKRALLLNEVEPSARVLFPNVEIL